ncbi:MAG: DUF6485 family protein [Candidatus Aminicenantes bacterium]|nr:DUF6485 family protein [Candidatus Aminicenantes bacterium]
MKECQEKKNLRQCTCTYEPCSRKGLCCECLAYHWRHRELPGCLFPPEVERTYDRSLARFLSVYERR